MKSVEENESNRLFNEWQEYERSLMPFKITSDLGSRIGKTVVNVYHTYYRNESHDIIVFDDGFALWKCKDNFVSCVSLSHAWWLDKSVYHDGYASAYLSNYGYVLKDLKLISEEQVEELLEKGRVFRKVQHKEEIKKEIQCRLDEISKLTDDL